MGKNVMVVGLLLAVFALSGCNRQDVPPKVTVRPVVVTTLFPLYDYARILAGDRMEVQLLLPPGLEPHHFEPRPDDLLRIHRAALFIYIGPFLEPWAERVITGVDRQKLRVVAAAEGIPLLPAPTHAGGVHGHQHQRSQAANDPHVWLDFAADQTMVATIASAMSAVDPAGADQYRQRADVLVRQLIALDERYRQGLASCESRVLLHGGHAAFGYLAHRYGLTYQAGTWGAGGGPTNGTLYIPSLVKELNMFEMLDNAISKMNQRRKLKS